jgi:hypothetical protein
MLFVLIILLAIVCGVFGALIKGLLWLLFIGVVLFVAGAVMGGAKVRGRSAK